MGEKEDIMGSFLAFLSTCRRRKHGFTLVEVVIAAAVIGILAAIAIPSILTYQVNNEMQGLNDKAKTVFLAMQDALMTYKNSGEFNDALQEAFYDNPPGTGGTMENVSLSGVSEAFEESKGNLVYMTVSKNAGKSEKLVEFIEPYLMDKSLLDGCFTVEFNRETGLVYAALYSDRADSLSYTEGGDGRTGVVNVSARAYDDLKQRRVGYYGDTPTGAPVSGTERPRPQIQNGEKLLVTWNDCEPAGSMGMNISYTLKILPSDGKGAPYLELSNILLSKTPMLPGGQQTLITRTPVYDQNGSMTGEVTENLLSHSLTYDIDKNEFTLVLDELVGKDGGVSIFEAYPTIPSGNIMAVVEVRAAGSPTQKGQSNVEHSYYASEAVTQEETVRRVATLRHFNNVRYGAADYRYLQTADFTWQPDLFDFAAFQNYPSRNASGVLLKEAETSDVFEGRYDGGGSFISGLRFGGEEENLGLFTRVGRSGELTKIALVDGEAAGGGKYTGALAGINEGHIHVCYASSTTVEGNGIVGGLVGANDGVVENCYVNFGETKDNEFFVSIKTTIPEAHEVGGLVGSNWSNGVIRTSYVNAMLANSTQVLEEAVLSRIGGIAGVNQNAAPDSIQNTAFLQQTIYNAAKWIYTVAGDPDSPEGLTYAAMTEFDGDAFVHYPGFGADVWMQAREDSSDPQGYPYPQLVGMKHYREWPEIEQLPPPYLPIWSRYEEQYRIGGAFTSNLEENTPAYNERYVFSFPAMQPNHFKDDEPYRLEFYDGPFRQNDGEDPVLVLEIAATDNGVPNPNNPKFTVNVPANAFGLEKDDFEITIAEENGIFYYFVYLYPNSLDRLHVSGSGFYTAAVRCDRTVYDQNADQPPISTSLYTSVKFNPHFGNATAVGSWTFGSVSHPFETRTPRQLRNVGKSTGAANYLADVFSQTNQIDFGVYAGSKGVSNYHKPIGQIWEKGAPETVAPFTGTYQGNQKEIRGLTLLSAQRQAGLFAENAGVVQEVVLRMPVIESTSSNALVGGIAAKNTGRVKACTVGPAPHTSDLSDFSGLMSTPSKLWVPAGGTVGGVVGENAATVTGCLNTARIAGDAGATAGGLVGRNDGMEAMVTLSYNAGAVETSEGASDLKIGGVLGDNRRGTVDSCYNTGRVLVKSVDEYGMVTPISAKGVVGGVVGVNQSGSTVRYSSSLGYVGNMQSGTSGGIVGQNDGTAAYCASVASVQHEAIGQSGFWSNAAVCEALSGADLKSPATMLPRLCANGNNVYAFMKTAENYYFPFASLRMAENLHRTPFEEAIDTHAFHSILTNSENLEISWLKYPGASSYKLFVEGDLPTAGDPAYGMTASAGNRNSFQAFDPIDASGFLVEQPAGGYLDVSHFLLEQDKGLNRYRGRLKITLYAYSENGNLLASRTHYAHTDFANDLDETGKVVMETIQKGDGSYAQAYQVSSPAHLEAVKYRLDANFVQTNVISLTNDFISDRYDQKTGMSSGKNMHGLFYPIGRMFYSVGGTGVNYAYGTGQPFDNQEISSVGNMNDNPSANSWQGMFRGYYDGGGYVITGLAMEIEATTSNSFFTGLFATIGETGVVRNLAVLNSKDMNMHFSGTQLPHLMMGSIAGYNAGLIQNCYRDGGVVTGTSTHGPTTMSIGGLVGYNAMTGKIYSSYNNSDVVCIKYYTPDHVPHNRGNNTGGIAALNAGQIYNCYNSGRIESDYRRVNNTTSLTPTGQIDSNNKIGGIVGVHYGSDTSFIRNCGYYQHGLTPVINPNNSSYMNDRSDYTYTNFNRVVYQTLPAVGLSVKLRAGNQNNKYQLNDTAYDVGQVSGVTLGSGRNGQKPQNTYGYSFDQLSGVQDTYYASDVIQNTNYSDGPARAEQYQSIVSLLNTGLPEGSSAWRRRMSDGLPELVDNPHKVTDQLAAPQNVQVSIPEQIVSYPITSTVKWDAVENAKTYTVYIQEQGTSNRSRLLSTDKLTASVTLDSFYAGRKWEFLVVTDGYADQLLGKAYLDSDPAVSGQAVVPPLPAPVLTLTNLNDGAVPLMASLSWTKVANAAQYELYVDGTLAATLPADATSYILPLSEDRANKVTLKAVHGDVPTLDAIPMDLGVRRILGVSLDGGTASADGAAVTYHTIVRYSAALTQADSLEVMVLDGSTIVKREQVSLAGTAGVFAYDMALPYVKIAGKTLTVRVTPVFDSSYVPVEPSDTLRKLTNPMDASLTVPYLQLSSPSNLTVTADGASAVLRWDAVVNNNGYEVVLEHQSSTGANLGTYRTVTAADALSYTAVLSRAVEDGDRLVVTVLAKGSDAKKTADSPPATRTVEFSLPEADWILASTAEDTASAYRVVLHWKPVSGAVRYQAEAVDVNSGKVLANAPDAPQTTMTQLGFTFAKEAALRQVRLTIRPYDQSGNPLAPLQVTAVIAKREDADVRASARLLRSGRQ